ncbi:XRE family transcriptional regulator [Streptomyces sp. NPDC056242]|uniref:XRE family transcriptional regulator n=1 Tax=Streptomyces sp. NPDC056242 TaxID=3345760 RepID=UPI0035DFCD2A
MDRTLAAATVSGDQLDLLEERLMTHRRRYVGVPPQTMLPDLVADLDDVRLLAEQRQPAATQARLSRMTALLATLIADALMKLGQLRAAAAWYATARTAADDSRDRTVQARVRIQAAILPYYYGPLDSAIHLTHEARLVTRGNEPEGTSAFGAVAHARALARRGDSHAAEIALRAAHELFAQLGHTREATDAFGFPARRFLLYTSGTLTYLGRPRQARAVQQEALALYPVRGAGIDPALLHFEEAICLVLERDVAGACRLAASTYLALPSEQRTQIVAARVRHILEAVPARMRSARAARELGEILALPRPRT